MDSRPPAGAAGRFSGRRHASGTTVAVSGSNASSSPAESLPYAPLPPPAPPDTRSVLATGSRANGASAGTPNGSAPPATTTSRVAGALAAFAP